MTTEGDVIAVLDVDSDFPDAFDAHDQEALEELCAMLGSRWGTEALSKMEAD
jgi:putative methionine-R-sulfoxide reductase with GAF domain